MLAAILYFRQLDYKVVVFIAVVVATATAVIIEVAAVVVAVVATATAVVIEVVAVAVVF